MKRLAYRASGELTPELEVNEVEEGWDHLHCNDNRQQHRGEQISFLI